MSDQVEPAVRALVQALRDELRKLVTPPPDDYLSTTAAAQFASVAVGTIRRWVRKGKLRQYNAGRLVRISRHELEKLMRGGPSNDGGTPEQRAARKYG